MSGELTISRMVDVDLDPAALWALIGTTEGWAQWLIDTADNRPVVAGAAIGVTDHDGVSRAVTVTAVQPGQSISFRWRTADEPTPSEVTLAIDESVDGDRTRILITETRPAGASSARLSAASSFGWSLPIVLLGFVGLLAAVAVH